MPVDDTELTVHRYVHSVVLRLHEIWVTRRLAAVKGRLQRTDPQANAEEYARVFAELMTLEKARRDLRERAFGVDA
jgi:DNA primase